MNNIISNFKHIIKITGMITYLMTMCMTVAARDIPLQKGDMLLQGYQKSISGNKYTRTSHLSYANQALIVRATDGTQSIVWETEAVPRQISNRYVTFVWIAGEAGTMSGKIPADFDFLINGHKKFTITSGTLQAWDVNNDEGSGLSFRPLMNTRSEDRIGYMYLRIPAKQLVPGVPLQLKIEGRNAKTNSWYMVFETPLKSEIQFTSRPAILQTDNGNLQPILADIHYFGVPATAKITIGNHTRQVPLALGHNPVEMLVEPIDSQRCIMAEINIGEKIQKQEIVLQPQRNWKVNFVQHTHTDIGYTRSQSEILAEHIRFIDYALDYCDATDNWPDDSKFRWTCESAWAVSEYLKSRPKQQIERLKKRVAEGRIELAAMYFNFDEMPDEQTLAASLYPVQQFRDEGLFVELAMQNDVNGIGWCFSEYFPDMGIKYLNMGTHGYKALISFDKPTAFWWESPSGKKTLTCRAEHYMFGNFMGIERDDFTFFENEVFKYLHKMDSMKYPFDIVSLQYSGYYTDNAPPSTAGPSMIKKWNEKYKWPKLRSASSSDFFKEIEKKYGNELVTIRGAWPDWWNDGFGSGAREAATSRLAHSDIIANQISLSMAKMLNAKLPEGIDKKIDEVNQALLFYDEHTFGFHESISNPFGKHTMEQRSTKMSYAWEAYRRSRPINETAMGLLQEYVPRAEVPSLVIYNPHNWKHSGVAKVYIDHEILPRTKQVEIRDEAGNIVPMQAVESYSDGTYWAIWVEDLPPLGYRQYFIRVKNDYPQTPVSSTDLKNRVIENQWYKIHINPEKGSISCFFDKELKTDLLSEDAEWQLGELIYERLGNRKDLDAFRKPESTRKGLDKVWFELYKEGPVWDSWLFRGETETGIGEKNYSFEIRVYRTVKRIDFVHLLKKKQVTDPEGIYVSFPFSLPDGEIFYDVPGGTIEAGVDQIPGSSNDWNTIQNFATVRNTNGQVLMGSQEVPLVQFGGLNCGRFDPKALPATTHIYSWPMNNYWTTNFNAEQYGEFEWSYYLTSSVDNSIEYATKFAWGNRIPLPVRVLPAGKRNIPGKSTDSVLEIIPQNVLLINMRPLENENAVVLHLREVGGKSCVFDARSTKVSLLDFKPCDANGKVIVHSGKINLMPWETKFIKVRWRCK